MIDGKRQCGTRRHLHVGKVAIAILVAGVLDLDADGAGIGVGLALPARHARMPGAAFLAHHLGDHAALVDEIVTGDAGGFAAQQVAGCGCAVHAGVVEKQHVHRALVAARLAIGGLDHTMRQRRDDHAAFSMMRS